MLRARFAVLLFCVFAIAACKGKKSEPSADESKPVAKASDKDSDAATKSVVSPTDAAPALVDAAATSSDAASFDAGQPDAAAAPTGKALRVTKKFKRGAGCFGWSAKEEVVVCVTGERPEEGKPVVAQVDFLGANGTGGTYVLDASFAEHVGELNQELKEGAFVELPPATKLPLNKGGALWTLREKETDSGEENVAPSYSVKLSAKCGGKSLEVYNNDEEGYSVNKAESFSVGEYAIVQLYMDRALEGEYGKFIHVFVLDTKECAADSYHNEITGGPY